MSDASVRSERRELTKPQEARIDRIVAEDRDVRVVGWDTAVQGPLLEINGWMRMAISPRGREINRPAKETV